MPGGCKHCLSSGTCAEGQVEGLVGRKWDGGAALSTSEDTGQQQSLGVSWGRAGLPVEHAQGLGETHAHTPPLVLGH
jgi:hypothetical protein